MSGASAMRNAIKRVTHKERAQPSWRKNKGFLEKHKDYIVRAKDYKNKKSYLKNLRKKADNKNADEFYFKMNNTKLVKGVHQEVKGKPLDIATVKLLKSQDMGYIVHKKCIDDKKVQKLQNNLHHIGVAPTNSHKIFLDNEEEVEKFDLPTHFQTLPELADRSYNRPKLSTIDEYSSKLNISERNMKRILNSKNNSYSELERRVDRVKKIEMVMKHLHTQRNIMGKGTKRKVQEEGEDGAPAVYKWKQKRAR
mmetsp:Transcript_6265/g.6472  ORF Transcript_6265/g.6472 Transcript_6265/m.6472 type:complete len:252 (-) Transcript_6265:232-987(-)